MSLTHLSKPQIQSLSSLYKSHTIDVLRLDQVHPTISGNKWYKLKEYLKDAKAADKKIVVTFGGTFSNHIVATAAACKFHNLKSVGIIRGEKPSILSHSLQTAVSYGMNLFFISREEYKKKTIPKEVCTSYNERNIYTINEGGYGNKGMQGAATILDEVDLSNYTDIIAAVGTGTTLAGLIYASYKNQNVIGISVLKNNLSLHMEIRDLLPADRKHKVELIHDYHFGGYAKKTKPLLDFINDWYSKTNIPSDFVYTGKLFFAVDDLLHKSYFQNGSKILIIHSGGLQGNNSLPKGTLIF